MTALDSPRQDRQQNAKTIAPDGTFGVFTEVTRARSASGCPSITLYTSRGDSMFGRSQGAYWSLTVEEASRLGLRLIQEAARSIVLPDAGSLPEAKATP